MTMRMMLTALLLVAAVASAQETAPKPLSVTVETLGDDEHGGVVTQVVFRFANPRRITEAGLFLEGSFTQEGRVPRNFRFSVPRKDDKLVQSSTHTRNGKLVKLTRWAIRPDPQNEMKAVHTFAAGKLDIDVRVVLDGDYGEPPTLVSSATQTFTIAKTNRPAPAADAPKAEEEAPRETGPVVISAVRRKDASPFVRVDVEVMPHVKRVAEDAFVLKEE
jgi:hypothetical protein